MGYEIDRIELPLREIGADKVYLITDVDEKETGALYLKELTRMIKKLVREKDFTVLNCPLWDFRRQRIIISNIPTSKEGRYHRKSTFSSLKKEVF
ncbi:MAG: DUF6293 family protein [Methanobacteriota archaeon]